jgi:hypothetical protein
MIKEPLGRVYDSPEILLELSNVRHKWVHYNIKPKSGRLSDVDEQATTIARAESNVPNYTEIGLARIGVPPNSDKIILIPLILYPNYSCPTVHIS